MRKAEKKEGEKVRKKEHSAEDMANRAKGMAGKAKGKQLGR
jgi:hypothetical protein